MKEMVRALFEQGVLYLDQVALKETDIPHLLREKLCSRLLVTLEAVNLPRPRELDGGVIAMRHPGWSLRSIG